MKVGILGAGMIVHDLLTFIHQVDGVELTAICALPEEKEKIEGMAKEHHIASTYVDYDEMLKDEQVEVVYVAVNNHLHYEMSMKALKAHKHVICEKPFTSHIEELEELNAVAKEEHLLLLEAISTQYLPNVLKMKELLSEVGNVKIVSANYSQYSSRYNAFKEGKILPAFDVTKSGGALMDLNIYNIHLLVALFGEPLHVEYQANIEKGIDTSGIMVLEYPHLKAISIGAKDCKAPITSTLQGDQGVIVIDKPMNQMTEYTFIDNKGHQTKYEFPQDQHRLYYEFEEFIRIINEKDFEKAQAMIELSLQVAQVMEKGRQQEGVIFELSSKIRPFVQAKRAFSSAYNQSSKVCGICLKNCLKKLSVSKTPTLPFP